MYEELIGAAYLFLAANVLLLSARGLAAIVSYSRRFVGLVCRAQTRLILLAIKPAIGLGISYMIVRYVKGIESRRDEL